MNYFGIASKISLSLFFFWYYIVSCDHDLIDLQLHITGMSLIKTMKSKAIASRNILITGQKKKKIINHEMITRFCRNL